ncbi:MAG TPA: hypothetical protein VFE37_16210 [Chloroflexota bacterium]|nr:hypothetical protein [Chloroflexota bacterium]
MAATQPTFPDLETFHHSHPGVTPAIGAYYAEAARVCLSHHHVPPTVILVEADDLPARSYRLDWPVAGQEQYGAWANRRV